MLQHEMAERTRATIREPGRRGGKTVNVIPWVAQVVVALILAQTLSFKFTYAPETQVMFGDRGGRAAAKGSDLAFPRVGQIATYAVRRPQAAPASRA